MAVNIPVTTPGAKAAIGNLRAIRSLVLSIGAGFAAFAVGRGFVSAIKLMRDFEFTMSRVRAIAGSTDEEFKSLSRTARELGATTIFSARQAAEGMTFLAQAGFDTNEIIQATSASLKLAQAGNLGLADAADIVSKSIRQFGLDASQAGMVADVLAKAAASSNTSVFQLGDAFRYAAPVAKALGLTLIQTAAAVGVVSNAGIQASQAGTGLRQAFLKLQKPSDDARKILDQIGLSQAFLTKNSNNLIGVFTRLRDAGLSVAQAQTVFGIRSVTAGLAILDNIDTIRDLNGVLADSEGFAAEFAAIVGDTLQGAFLSLRSGIEEAILQLGDTGFLRSLTDLIKVSGLLVARFNGMEKAFLDSSRITEGHIRTANILGKALEVLRAIAAALIARFIILRGLGMAQVFLSWAKAAFTFSTALAAVGGALRVVAKVAAVALSFFAFKEVEVFGASIKRWRLWVNTIKASLQVLSEVIKRELNFSDITDRFRELRNDGIVNLVQGFKQLKEEGDLRSLNRGLTQNLNEINEGVKISTGEIAELTHEAQRMFQAFANNDALTAVGPDAKDAGDGLSLLRKEFQFLELTQLDVGESSRYTAEEWENLLLSAEILGETITDQRKAMQEWEKVTGQSVKSNRELREGMKDATDDVRNAGFAIEKAREELKLLNDQLEAGDINAETFRRRTQLLTDDIKRQNETIRDGTKAYGEFSQELDRNLQKQLSTFKEVLSIAGEALDVYSDIRDAIQERDKAIGDVNQIREQQAAVESSLNAEIGRGADADRAAIASYERELRDLARQHNSLIFDLRTEHSNEEIAFNGLKSGLSVIESIVGLFTGRQSFQEGGIVRGTGPQTITAHGGEAIFNPRQLNNLNTLIGQGGGNMNLIVRNESGNPNTKLQIQDVRQTGEGLDIVGIITNVVEQNLSSGRFDGAINSRFSTRNRGG